jgi:hypothetical protein
VSNEAAIKSLTIYKTQEWIGFVKFIYRDAKKKEYETKLPFDPALLKHYQARKYEATGNAYLQGFAVALLHGRVAWLSFTWSDGSALSEGNLTEKCTRFKADIEKGERPFRMFGSVVLGK